MSSSKRGQDSSQEAENDAPNIPKRVRWDNEAIPPDSAASETSHSEDASELKVSAIEDTKHVPFDFYRMYARMS